MSPTMSLRLSEGEIETLDRLVVAVRAYYEKQGEAFPPAKSLAKEVTRSSALRDLLLAWKYGITHEFSRDLTTPPRDAGQNIHEILGGE